MADAEAAVAPVGHTGTKIRGHGGLARIMILNFRADADGAASEGDGTNARDDHGGFYCPQFVPTHVIRAVVTANPECDDEGAEQRRYQGDDREEREFDSSHEPTC